MQTLVRNKYVPPATMTSRITAAKLQEIIDCFTEFSDGKGDFDHSRKDPMFNFMTIFLKSTVRTPRDGLFFSQAPVVRAEYVSGK